MKKASVFTPFPELIEEKRHDSPWNFKDCEGDQVYGTSDLVNRRMVVPMGPIGTFISAHEMGHVKWSPTKVPKVSYDSSILQIVEDARVNMGLDNLNVPCPLGDQMGKFVSGLFDADKAFERYDKCILRAISALGTDIEHRMKRKIRGLPSPWNYKGETWVIHIERSLKSGAARNHSPVAKFALTRKLALQLAKEMDDLKESGKPDPRKPVPTSPPVETRKPFGRPVYTPDDIGKTFATSEPISVIESMIPPSRSSIEIAIKRDGVLIPKRKRVKPAKNTSMSLFQGATMAELEACDEDIVSRSDWLKWQPKSTGSFMGFQGSSVTFKPEADGDSDLAQALQESGEMEIIEPPLPIMQRKVAVGTAPIPKCAMEGTMIRRPDRLCIDRAIFTRVSRSGVGSGFTGYCSILVDVSGSMCLDDDDIENIIVTAGGFAKVAIYCGDETKGELKIVAENARRATPKDMGRIGCGNIVDVPALLWLASQPLPRVWICDGSVTGIGDGFYASINAQTQKIRRDSKIVRVHDIDAALKHIEGLRGTNIYVGKAESVSK